MFTIKTNYEIQELSDWYSLLHLSARVRVV